MDLARGELAVRPSADRPLALEELIAAVERASGTGMRYEVRGLRLVARGSFVPGSPGEPARFGIAGWPDSYTAKGRFSIASGECEVEADVPVAGGTLELHILRVRSGAGLLKAAGAY
jgi:hypothetical protein